jgi:hypothetical protein
MGCAAPNPLHWQDLRNRPSENILRQEGVSVSYDSRAYDVAFLNALYRVDPTAERIMEIAPKPHRVLTEEFQILLIRYLVAPNGGPVLGVPISEKDLPGGVTFFQGPHTLHLAPIAKRYGKDPDAFGRRSRDLAAVPAAYGDKAMRFSPFPLIPVTYILWTEDDEFPATATVLFDRSISDWFELDMIFTLVMVLTERLLEE